MRAILATLIALCVVACDTVDDPDPVVAEAVEAVGEHVGPDAFIFVANSSPGIACGTAEKDGILTQFVFEHGALYVLPELIHELPRSTQRASEIMRFMERKHTCEDRAS